MRYDILYRRGPGSEFTMLVPGEHLGLYDRREVTQAIDFMLANDAVVGVALQLDIEQFNIMRIPNGSASLAHFTR